MQQKQIDRPLGAILHIVNGEAITQPVTPFTGKNAIVVLENQKEIGRLGDPFGLTNHPYQPIILNNPDQEDIVGKQVYAQIRKSSKKRYKNRQRKKGRK